MWQEPHTEPETTFTSAFYHCRLKINDLNVTPPSVFEGGIPLGECVPAL